MNIVWYIIECRKKYTTNRHKYSPIRNTESMRRKADVKPTGMETISNRNKASKLYSEIYLFRNFDLGIFFNQEVYKMLITISSFSIQSHPVNCLFYIWARTIFFGQKFLVLEKHKVIYTGDQPPLINKNSQKVTLVRNVFFNVQIRDTRAWVVFSVMRKKVIFLLLRISFVKSFIKGIFVTNWKVVSYRF